MLVRGLMGTACTTTLHLLRGMPEPVPQYYHGKAGWQILAKELFSFAEEWKRAKIACLRVAWQLE